MNAKTALSGLFWNGAESFSLQVIQLLVSMVLARLLTPADFGLIALMTFFIAASDTLARGGFRGTIIMRQNLGQIDLSTAFVYNLAVAILLYGILFLTAPLIAGFYQEPALIKLLRVLGLINVLHAGCFVQDALLQKNMRFKFLAQRNVTASIIAGVLAIGMAYLGFGVWSLVCLTMAKAVVINVYLWLNSVWKLSLRFSWVSFKRNFSFGSRLMLSDFSNMLYNNINNLLIGKYYSKADLGYYYQARKLKDVPIQAATAILTRTSTPMIARQQDDMEQLHKVYFRIIRISALCILPLVTLMILVGDDLIRILYSSKWEASIPIFRIILLGAMFMPFIIINGQAPAIMGDSRAYFYINLGKNALFLIVTFVSLRFGLLIFITCQTGLSVILMALNSLVVKFYYKIGLKAQLFAYLPYIFYSFMAGLAVFLAFHFSDLPPLFEAIAGSLLFVLLYALSIYVFERKTFKEALDIAKSGMNKLRPKNA